MDEWKPSPMDRWAQNKIRMKDGSLYKLSDHGKTLAKLVENWYDEARSLFRAKDVLLVFHRRLSAMASECGKVFHKSFA